MEKLAGLKKLEAILENALQKSNDQRGVFEFVQQASYQSASVGIGAWFLATLVLQDALTGFLLALPVGFGIWVYLLYGPVLRLKQVGVQIEKDLPFALMAASVELNLGIPFERVLLDISRQDYAKASEEFRIVFDEVSLRGSSVPEALQHFSERISSQEVRRALSLLVNAYEQGGGKNRGEPIRRIAVELLSKQRSKTREFGGKLTVFSLLFVAISAIVPALFLSFVIVGSLFLSLELSAMQVLAISAIGFPLLDLGVLLYIQSQTPVYLKR